MTSSVADSSSFPAEPLAEERPSERAPVAGAPGSPRSPKPLFVLLAVVAAGLGGGGLYASSLGHESTDDAQIDAEVVAVPARITGTVRKVAFVENQSVKAGDLLALLDDEGPKAKLAQAEAALQSARAAAEAADADAEVAATNALGNKAAADATVVAASSGALSAEDQIREAQAALGAAEATLAQSRTDRDRTARLAASGALSPASLEQAETGLALATANADVARAR